MTTALTPIAQTSVLRLEDYNRVQNKASGAGIIWFILFGFLVTIGFVVGTAYWAFTSKLDGAVVAPASFVVDGNRKTVQHLDGGIVSDILVRNGDLVEAG